VKTQRNTFEADWAEWHRRHEERRAGPHGFLAITGRHWLTPEPQRFGDAPGAWSASGDTVTVTLDDDEDLAVDGEPVHGTYTFAPIPEAYPPDPRWVVEGRYLPYAEPPSTCPAPTPSSPPARWEPPSSGDHGR
jgi:uncharacterized protein